MIRVTVELLPGGDESKRRHLGTAKIANDGTGTRARGNYRITLSRRGRPNSVWRTGGLKGFARRRLNAWHLLLYALAATIHESQGVHR